MDGEAKQMKIDIGMASTAHNRVSILRASTHTHRRCESCDGAWSDEDEGNYAGPDNDMYFCAACVNNSARAAGFPELATHASVRCALCDGRANPCGHCGEIGRPLRYYAWEEGDRATGPIHCEDNLCDGCARAVGGRDVGMERS